MSELVRWVESVHPAAHGGAWTAIEKGGSDRRFWRGSGAAEGLVAMAYGGEKAENTQYADCAMFLRARGVNVPGVLAHDASAGFMLLEDGGSDDLWSHREAPWEARRELYVRALEQAARMHAVSLPDAEHAGVVQQPFDAALYRWEQDYFFTHFMASGAEDAASLREELPLAAQAEELAARPRVLLHRDFQSQNILVRGGDVSLIDFQGMRGGLAGYDVASLLYDPYVPMSAGEREELAAVYAGLAGRGDAAAWGEELCACARQRLMQALGAYGFLGRVKGRRQFLAHVPVAAERLAALCEAEPDWKPMADAVRRAAQRGF